MSQPFQNSSCIFNNQLTIIKIVLNPWLPSSSKPLNSDAISLICLCHNHTPWDPPYPGSTQLWHCPSGSEGFLWINVYKKGFKLLIPNKCFIWMHSGNLKRKKEREKKCYYDFMTILLYPLLWWNSMTWGNDPLRQWGTPAVRPPCTLKTGFLHCDRAECYDAVPMKTFFWEYKK